MRCFARSQEIRRGLNGKISSSIWGGGGENVNKSKSMNFQKGGSLNFLRRGSRNKGVVPREGRGGKVKDGEKRIQGRDG